MMIVATCGRPNFVLKSDLISTLRRSGIFYFVFILLLVELFIRGLVSWPNEAAEPPYLRNPTPYRGWPEYVSRTEANKKNLILLGNSQGVGTELPDVSTIYAYKAYNALAKRDPSLALHNWSVTGLLAHQLELLSLKALSYDPALLILSVSLHNFNPTGELTLIRDETDIPLLMWDVDVLSRDWLRTSLVRNSSSSELVRIFFNKVSAIGRARTAGFDRLAQEVPWKMHRLVFGHRRPQPVLTPIYDRKETSQPTQIRPLQINSPESHWDRQFRGKQLPVALEFYGRLKQKSMEHGTKIVWVWMPFARRDDTSTLLDAMQKIHIEFCALVIADGSKCLDFSEELDPDYFISADLSSHLTRTGHEQMAKLVTTEILDALY